MSDPRPRSAGPPSLAAGGEDRPLLAFLPMIYVAWGDGELTRQELEAIHEQVRCAAASTPRAAGAWPSGSTRRTRRRPASCRRCCA